MKGSIGFILVFGVMYYYIPDLATQLFKSVGHLLATLLGTLIQELHNSISNAR